MYHTLWPIVQPLESIAAPFSNVPLTVPYFPSVSGLSPLEYTRPVVRVRPISSIFQLLEFRHFSKSELPNLGVPRVRPRLVGEIPAGRPRPRERLLGCALPVRQCCPGAVLLLFFGFRTLFEMGTNN